MRKLFFNLHLWGSLLSSVFIVIVCLTGAIIAFEGELDRAMNPRLFRVEPPAGAIASRKPVAEWIQAAIAGTKDKGTFVHLSDDPADSVGVSTPGRKQTFLNPYTGEILGVRTGTTVLADIHQLHSKLLMGDTGKRIVGIGTIFLLFLSLSGIYLWWPSKRFSVKWGASARRVHFDLHHVAGIATSVFVVILCLTGLFINFDDEIVPHVYAWTKSEPTPRDVRSNPQPGIAPLPHEQMIAIAKATIPGTTLVNLQIPGGPKGAYRVSLRFPEDLTPGGRSWVTMDQYTGAVLVQQNSRIPPAGTGYIITNRAIHTGDIFGIPSKIVASISCLAVLIQVVTGLYLWWKKRGKPAAREEMDVLETQQA
ncbi:MAG TPA: PepSY-associated TM helix domain-containing protein [Bryobacteraceae bacterium]|nr:PepSY-associated TM helix domain-containing protein [Bryobacteraceae bacterium]